MTAGQAGVVIQRSLPGTAERETAKNQYPCIEPTSRKNRASWIIPPEGLVDMLNCRVITNTA